MAAIIFDFDGTIADSLDYFIDFISAEAKQAPLSPSRREQLHGLSLVGIARNLGLSWLRLPDLYIRGRKRMQPVIKELEVFQGMPEVIKKLHAEGHELFLVSSNSVHNIHEFLHAQKLHTYFLEMYGGVGIFGKGPALRRMMREQKLDIADAVYIGDELRDVQSAKSINMRCIAVTWGFSRAHDLAAAGPTALAHQPADIIKALEEM